MADQFQPDLRIIRRITKRARRGVKEQLAEASHTDRDLSKEFLSKLIPALNFAIHRQADYPKRTELLGRLSAIDAAARLLKRALADPTILALLEGGDGYIPDIEIASGLQLIIERASAIIKSNPRMQGRGHLYPAGEKGPSAQTYCALMVGMMWERAFGRWPPNKNKYAHGICELLWKAAEGGPRTGWGREGHASVAVWRHHLGTAKDFRPPHPSGVLVERFLANPEKPSRTIPRLSRPIDFYDHPRSRKSATGQPNAVSATLSAFELSCGANRNRDGSG
jgi:hypothetical protein